MIVPYVPRLLCLCLASFFLVNCVFGLVVSVASRAAVRFGETMGPREATRLLFALRVLPLAFGVVVILGLCVPSYLWLEPEGIPERAGLVCITLACLGAASWFLSFTRAARATAVSIYSYRCWQQAGREARLPGEASKAVIVARDAPLLALAGLLRPQLVISDGVLRSLSSEELNAALHHENAHRASRDNLKRLLLLLLPDPIPFFPACSLLEQTWAKFTEWAADDEAAGGDSRRALSLAAALLRVAQMGAGPRLSFLHTSLVADDGDLSARINRLLVLEPACPKSLPWARFFARGAAFLLTGFLATLTLWPASLSTVHRLLELFLR
jgi:Zn-dependent protease with chaperone function